LVRLGGARAMTKEQEEAIEMLEDIENNTWTTKYIMSSDSKKAETVLSMLKEKDREMEKKDKIIDLMATFIDAQNIRMLEDEYTAIKNIYTIIGFDKDKEGIKQYFERKARNEH